MNRTGLTLMEETFCQLVAVGKGQTEAYAEAFGIALAPGREDEKRKVTRKASYLAQRPDIQSRIIEAQGEEKRRNRKKWEDRGEGIAERLYAAIEGCTGATILSKEALKGIEVLAKLKGLNAPDTTVLKDGGKSEDDDTPRSIAALSNEQLNAFIDVGDESETEGENE